MAMPSAPILDGSSYERDGVGFAGTKGFCGGFGRGALTSFGEPEVKAFVKAGIDEAMNLENHLQGAGRRVVAAGGRDVPSRQSRDGSRTPWRRV